MLNNGQKAEPSLDLARGHDPRTPERLAAELASMAQGGPRPSSESDVSSPADITAAVKEAVNPLLAPLVELCGYVSRLIAAVEECQIQARILTDMHDRCRELSERYHEREVLGPVLRSLIGQVERFRQQHRKLTEMLDRNSENGNQAALRAIQTLLEWRKGDIAEIEGMLTTFGVERFEGISSSFDPASQTCLQRCETTQPEQDGHVAERLQSGYRRGDWMISRECVAVFVLNQKLHHLTKGEPQ